MSKRKIAVILIMLLLLGIVLISRQREILASESKLGSSAQYGISVRVLNNWNSNSVVIFHMTEAANSQQRIGEWLVKTNSLLPSVGQYYSREALATVVKLNNELAVEKACYLIYTEKSSVAGSFVLKQVQKLIPETKFSRPKNMTINIADIYSEAQHVIGGGESELVKNFATSFAFTANRHLGEMSEDKQIEFENINETINRLQSISDGKIR